MKIVIEPQRGRGLVAIHVLPPLVSAVVRAGGVESEPVGHIAGTVRELDIERAAGIHGDGGQRDRRRRRKIIGHDGADTLTMRNALGEVHGATVAYVGDYNNVARSLAEASIMLGMHVRLGCPDGFQASVHELARLDSLGTGTIDQSADPAAAVSGAQVVHTDTWTSMGQEAEKAERKEVFGRYQVNGALMARAAGDAWFMHCLPAYRGLEVSADVIDGPRSLVIQQGHNRMHTARGVLAFLMGVRP